MGKGEYLKAKLVSEPACLLGCTSPWWESERTVHKPLKCNFQWNTNLTLVALQLESLKTSSRCSSPCVSSKRISGKLGGREILLSPILRVPLLQFMSCPAGFFRESAASIWVRSGPAYHLSLLRQGMSLWAGHLLQTREAFSPAVQGQKARQCWKNKSDGLGRKPPEEDPQVNKATPMAFTPIQYSVGLCLPALGEVAWIVMVSSWPFLSRNPHSDCLLSRRKPFPTKVEHSDFFSSPLPTHACM